MRLSTIAARLSQAGVAVGAVALTAMIVLITVQVISRRILTAPMVVADELSGYLLVITTFSALGYALLHGDHIQVTLVTDRLSDRLRRYLRVAWCLVGLPYVGLLVWRSAVLVLDSYHSGSFSVTATNVVLWPIQAFVPLGLAVLFVQMLAELLEALNLLRRGAA
ncbi:TRAP transporter small permease [Vineibacter terrae]|uniref:TRAP transporter small permease protein n=1 Tax=Vineibacter terrae TaxID=2586908 RepID=A0A5C8PRG0_9HYPH|nr:TRAP transporter small permease [Vineibacter terrae]TXL77611.1 TRAP transporter small permease [Vineibacter terrae]